ncbi:porin [Candidimonas sp. SYP-B2681]|uniref:porin n=1 Tax=Candidimonas sp. SYP-B2681 TaxID=2497686 RepID=UPI000F87A043|nr:porin [Candidimonas sp. SYP-B2681]RTZ42428.1 porin [Candidimonas sp. SYP-B2681]
MKKTLLAAALIAGFAGVAQAETSVTLYGILDGGIGYQKLEAGPATAKKTGIINGIQSGNRWGLKGSEDLGNGLRAVFQLESGFDLGTGNSAQGGRLFGRQATLGLAGDSWGQLDVGRQTNIGSKYFGAIDPFALGFNQANVGTTFSAVNTVRYDNMVMYQTPNFSGFQFGAGYSFSTNGNQGWDIDAPGRANPNDTNNRAVTTGIRYVNGPLAAALTYDQSKIKATNVNVKSWNLGGAYDFEVVKAHAAIGQTHNGLFSSGISDEIGGVNPLSGINLDGLKVNSYMLGLTAPIGNGKLLASWQMADPRSNPDVLVATDLEKTQIYSLGYTYGLSKRTNLYAIGSYAKNAFFLDSAKSTLVGVGVRHQF